ncbi:MAG: NAD(+)/NADH kinase [Planctomycetes bacterium]|nr:NAD(+)/NADH kinase [Planctomycetota bacterium]
MFDKIVLVTRKTRLEGLIGKFNSRAQAKFWIEHAGGDFTDYVREDDAYRRSLETLRRSLDLGLKMQSMDREFAPTCLFAEGDIVVTAGQDGLVANTAKYVGSQPIVAVNPDPERFDGVLLSFSPENARPAVERVLSGRARVRDVTLAEAGLSDGQRLLAFNDFFIGARSHVSARYVITYGDASEPQSSSGILVSTGAGSTGWLSSVFNMANAVAAATGGKGGWAVTLDWEDPRLYFVVREPFVSRHSRAGLVAGMLEPGTELIVESRMSSGGAIFSDGVEADYLSFDGGSTVRVRAADRKARLVVG